MQYKILEEDGEVFLETTESIVSKQRYTLDDIDKELEAVEKELEQLNKRKAEYNKLKTEIKKL